MLFGLAFLAGLYLIVRDHFWHPFHVLAREIPDPAQMWRLIGRCFVSGLGWSPVLGLGAGLLCVDAEYGWKVAQFLFIFGVWHIVSSRVRPSVNQITQDMMPESG